MDFHPNMLAGQRMTVRQPLREAGFHPHMLGRQPLAGLQVTRSMLPGMGTVAPAPAAPAPQFGFDAQSGELIIGANRIKLVSAILSALAVKIVFFGGDKLAKGAKHLHRKWRGEPAVATNPCGSQRPWQAVRFNPNWSRAATKRHKTRRAAEAWAAQHDGPSRVSCVG